MIDKIGQIAITVSNIEKSMLFYRDTIGLKYLFHDNNVALFDLNGIRLMLGKNESDQKKPFGMIIYFMVNEINSEFEKIKNKGVKTIREPHFTAKYNDKEIWLAFFKDMDENIFALMEERRL